MKKTLLFLILALSFASCKEKDEIIEEYIEVGDGYYNTDPMALNEVVTHLTAVIGAIPSDIGAAINKRFTGQTSQIFPESTRVIIFDMSNLYGIDEEAFMEVYRNDGIIIVLEPDYQLLNEWLEEIGLRHPDTDPYPVSFSDTPDTPHELYAFNQSDNHYFLDYVHSDFDHNDFLNPLVRWVNKYVNGPVPPPSNVASESDVRKIFGYQTIEHTYNLSLKVREAKIASSNPDSIIRSGQISVVYTIYPLYSFADQTSPGDYYLVNMRVTAHNAQMYQGRYTSRHGLVYCRICGFYLEKLTTTSEIITTSGYSARFPSFGTPMPTTTVGQTSYSSGLSWNLGGSLSGTIGSSMLLCGTISGGVTFSNTQDRSISDVDVLLNTSGSNVKYEYPFNNLPYYWALKITDPPAISVNDAEFVQDWVWRVPESKDGETRSFQIRNTISPQYGSCHFYSSASDYVRHHWFWKDNAIRGDSVFTVTLTPPNRIPTGQIIIHSNSGQGIYITDVKLWKSTSNTKNDPDYTVTGSFAYGQDMSQYFPVGDYWIQIMAGPNTSSLTAYHLSSPVRVERAGTVELNSGFDFDKGAY